MLIRSLDEVLRQKGRMHTSRLSLSTNCSVTAPCESWCQQKNVFIFSAFATGVSGQGNRAIWTLFSPRALLQHELLTIQCVVISKIECLSFPRARRMSSERDVRSIQAQTGSRCPASSLGTAAPAAPRAHHASSSSTPPTYTPPITQQYSLRLFKITRLTCVSTSRIRIFFSWIRIGIICFVSGSRQKKNIR